MKTERFYTVSYALNGSKAGPLPTICLKGQWLKADGFEIGFTFTVKILNCYLLLITDSEDICAIKQQNQQQQAQLDEFKLRTLIGE
ncbi:SymE family type I addiction module toxin [Providencia stuartii]|uniref:SymE family type I addiction module toxin n=1 Tax=Providencia stuartii TaxID=588 RepID=UPI00090060F9|nr:SymE family type I addiction module toxin [Providencia stuartii]AMG68814.2 type I toxin-antitoxin system SymE family toxin [Providencia stuartii]HEM8215657.1 SymE family type I addiction module toxin [Providencia stuartii]